VSNRIPVLHFRLAVDVEELPAIGNLRADHFVEHFAVLLDVLEEHERVALERKRQITDEAAFRPFINSLKMVTNGDVEMNAYRPKMSVGRPDRLSMLPVPHASEALPRPANAIPGRLRCLGSKGHVVGDCVSGADEERPMAEGGT